MGVGWTILFCLSLILVGVGAQCPVGFSLYGASCFYIKQTAGLNFTDSTCACSKLTSILFQAKTSQDFTDFTSFKASNPIGTWVGMSDIYASWQDEHGSTALVGGTEGNADCLDNLGKPMRIFPRCAVTLNNTVATANDDSCDSSSYATVCWTRAGITVGTTPCPTTIQDRCDPTFLTATITNGVATPNNLTTPCGRGPIVGSTVTYSCSAGYDLYGISPVTCQASNLWTWPTVPLCEKQCADYTAGVNLATLTYTNTVGTMHMSYTYGNISCAAGLVLTGSSVQTCSARGGWLGCPSKCNLDCPATTVVSNAVMTYTPSLTTTTADHETVLHIDCNSAYTLSGHPDLTCQDGSWDFAYPTCLAPCADQPLSNGAVSYSITVGTSHPDSSTASFTCNSAYTLNGPDQVYCSNGVWVGGTASCLAPCTNQVVEYANVKYSEQPYSNTFYPDGTLLTTTCLHGYRMEGSNPMICSNGNWIGSLPVCYAACPDQGTISNGQYIYSRSITQTSVNDPSLHPDSSTMYTICSMYYQLSGCNQSVCVNGAWSNSGGQCLAPCPDNQIVPRSVNVTYLSTFGPNLHPHLSTTTAVCSPPFTQLGGGNQVCYDGVWYGRLPSCFSPCKPLTPTQFMWYNYTAPSAVVSGTYPHGTTVSFGCGYNATLDMTVGNAVLLCSKGKWLGKPPVCKAPCADYATFANLALANYSITAAVTNQHTSGTWVTLTCDTGYDLVGPMQTVCDNGKWKHSLQWCRESVGFWWWPWLVGFLVTTTVIVIFGIITSAAIRAESQIDDHYKDWKPLWFW